MPVMIEEMQAEEMPETVREPQSETAPQKISSAQSLALLRAVSRQIERQARLEVD